MMDVTARSSAAKYGCAALSAGLIVSGAMYAAGNPMPAVLTGVIVMLYGLIRLFGYFSGDLYRLAFQHDLAIGVMLVLLGAAQLFRPGLVGESAGIIVLVDGLFKLQTSLDARRFGLETWAVLLGLALLSCLTGAAALFGGLTGLRGVGIALIADGLMSLTTVLISVKIQKRQKNLTEA